MSKKSAWHESAYLQKHATRALHIALGAALGGTEQTLTCNTWRTLNPVTAAYFTAFAGWSCWPSA